MVKRTVFKMEVFDDFTMDSFFALPRLGTDRKEPLSAKAISGTCEYLIELYRISLQPDARKRMLDMLESQFRRGEK